MSDLKACPFCGRIPDIEDCGEHRWFIRCKCGIAQDKLFYQKCDAVRAWNKRKELRVTDTNVPITDTISRQAAIDAVRSIVDDTPDSELPLEDVLFRDGIQYAISILSNLPSVQPEEDTIEMQEADIDEAMKLMRDARVTILPSAEPVRMKGKWERHYSRPNVYADMYWHCSVCGYKNGENFANIYHHFCPNCGSEMEEEKHKSVFYFPSDEADMRGEQDE